MNYLNRLSIYIDNNTCYVVDKKIPSEIKYQVLDGVRFSINQKIELTLKNTTKNYPDIMGAYSFPIVSEKVKIILESLSDRNNFQFFECAFKNSKNKSKYFYLNILGNIKCLNKEKSIYRSAEGNPDAIMEITVLFMNMDAKKERNLFRMEEFPIKLFISSDLENLLEKEGITGYKISATENLTEDF